MMARMVERSLWQRMTMESFMESLMDSVGHGPADRSLFSVETR